MVGLCDLCAGFRIENLRYGKYDWHPSLVVLRRSQEKGCPLCVFLWRILLSSHKPEEIQQIIDAGDKKISLDGDFEGCDFENLFIPVGVAIRGDSVANGWSLNGYASIFATNGKNENGILAQLVGYSQRQITSGTWRPRPAGQLANMLTRLKILL
jgi:hypothetical protein